LYYYTFLYIIFVSEFLVKSTHPNDTGVKRLTLANRPDIPKHHYIINVLVSVVIMCCSGSVYAWSIFVSPLQGEFGLTTTHTQLIFGLIIASFVITELFVGRIERRLGPKVTGSIGAVLFSAGYLLASFSGGNVIIILLGISILSGAGIGFGYVTVLATLVKWFPDHKGLATGIAVAGFGSGAILLSLIVQPVLESGEVVLNIFRMIGIIYGVLFLVSALAMSAPRVNREETTDKPLGVKAISRDKRFWVLFYTFFAGSFAGLMLTGNLKPMGLSYGIGEESAVTGIVLLSAGNAAGRLLWGQIYDKIGGKRSVSLALSLLAAFTLPLLTRIPNSITFPVLMLVIGLCYGANYVLYAADVANIYGIYQIGIIYPRVSLAYGISGIVGPVAGGLIFDATNQYSIPIILSVAICLTGLIAYVSFMDKIPGSGTPTKRFKGVPDTD
jgi:OFA family oxalate/formate antiporter-like MFS transporter